MQEACSRRQADRQAKTVTAVMQMPPQTAAEFLRSIKGISPAKFRHRRSGRGVDSGLRRAPRDQAVAMGDGDGNKRQGPVTCLSSTPRL